MKARVMKEYEMIQRGIRVISEKISELNSDLKEHELVINAIKDLDTKRKCWRKIGGVLVERTVGEVLPAVKKNHEQILDVIEKLKMQLQEKQTESEQFIAKYQIKFADEAEQTMKGKEDQNRNQGTTGLLV